MNSRRGLRVLVVGGLCVALAALGLGSASARPQAAAPVGHTWHVIVGAQTPDEAIQTMAFYPRHLWVDQGDTVVWSTHSAEIHTVTFLAPGTKPGPFNPGDPSQSTPQGSHTYDGHSYDSSGTLVNHPNRYQGRIALPPFVHLHRTYRLTFPETLAPGTYRYLCLVHGSMMSGSVVVQKRGTPYPFGQAAYDRQAQRAIRADLADGQALLARGEAQARRLTRRHGTTVLVGVMDQRAMVARFIPSSVTVPRGGHVILRATSMGEPHTVTFGSDVTGCGTPPCDPSAPWNVARAANGNIRADYPGRNGGFTGSPRDLNSGVMFGLAPTMTGVPEKLTLTMTRPGHFGFSCALHDYFGMLGAINVERTVGRR